MYGYVINLLTKASKVLVIITFISLFTALTSLVFTINKHYGLGTFVKSEDFTAYFTSAKMIVSGDGSFLYDLNKQLSYQNQIDSSSLNIKVFRPFINPPFVASIFIPLSFLRLNIAYFIWVIINLILLIYIFKIIFLEFKQKFNFKKTILFILLLVSFPPIIITLISGQLSLFLVLSFLMTRKELITGNKLKAGFWLSLLFLKPQYIFLPVIYLIYKKEFKMLSLFSAIGIGLFLISISIIGYDGFFKYFEQALLILNWKDMNTVIPSLSFSLRGFLQLISQNNNFLVVFLYWVLSVIFVCFLVFYSWTKKQKNTVFKFDMDWAMIIIASILITPYISGQDTSVLIIPAIIIYFWSKKMNLSEIKQDLIFIFLIIGYIIVAISGFFVIFLHIHIQVIYTLLFLIILFWIQIKQKAKLLKN